MVSLLTLVVCLFIGLGLRHVKSIPENTPSTLGTLILYVPLPAVCLLSIPFLEWNSSLISLTLVTWIIFGVAFVFFNFLGQKFHWEKSLIGSLILTAGFCNSAFVGFPVIEALFGKEALKHAIFLDQSGSFLIASSLGIWVALTYSSGKIKKRLLIKKVLVFPPFVAFSVSLILGALGWTPEGITKEILERLAGILTPMALISVGLQLRWDAITGELRYLSVGLFYKLLLAPGLIFSLYLLFGVEKKIFNISVIEAGMAPMITSSILAMTHGLRPKLAGVMLGVGVPLSFLTLSFWYWLIGQF
jgi:predicted permease